MLNIDKRISKQELENIFGVDRATIENWRKNHGLPIIEISSHSKYIRIDDLIEWENSMIGKGCEIQSVSKYGFYHSLIEFQIPFKRMNMVKLRK